MKSGSASFSSIVESVYNLPLEFKEELRTLLDRNISDSRRLEILENFKAATKEHKGGKLHFKSNIDDLKKLV